MIFPIYWMLVRAFATGTLPGGIIPDPATFTLDYFTQVVSKKNFGTWYLNTTIVALLTTFIATSLSIFSGYALARFVFPARKTFGMIIILIQLAPGVLVAIPLYSILFQLGLLNTYVGLSAAYITRALPFCTWMLWGFFRELSTELEEAAAIDGANRWQVLTRIALPLSWPGIAVAAMFTFALAWEEYLFALMIMTRETALTLTIGASRLVTTESVSIGELMAYSVLMTIPVAVVFGFVQKHMVHGLSAGALKG
jgi:ABC-type glycerol-3-phosphate transport system permease component